MFLNLLIWCFLFLNIICDVIAEETVTFDIHYDKAGKLYKCKSSANTLTVKHGDPIHVAVVGNYDFLNEATCSLENSTKLFLVKRDFVKTKNDNSFHAKIENSTVSQNGIWNCTFLTRKNVASEQFVIVNGDIYIRVICSVQVNITGLPDVKADVQGIDTKTWYIIGGVVAALIILIIIAQTAVILHFKAKANRALPRLERPSTNRDDSTRYSAMPGERKRSHKKREESCIYQSLENINAGGANKTSSRIKERPPMPLPDEDRIYDDGNTLQRMFAPIPPSLDTLPKNSVKKDKTAKNKPVPNPKPSKSMPMEEYDYPDTVELITSKDSLNRPVKKPVPVPPKPTKMAANPAQIGPKPKMTGNPMMSELGNLLKRKNLNAQTEATPQTPILSGIRQQGIRPPHMQHQDMPTLMQPQNMPVHPMRTQDLPPHPMRTKDMAVHSMRTKDIPAHPSRPIDMQAHPMQPHPMRTPDIPVYPMRPIDMQAHPIRTQDTPGPHRRPVPGMPTNNVRAHFTRTPSRENITPPYIPSSAMGPQVSRSPPVPRVHPVPPTYPAPGQSYQEEMYEPIAESSDLENSSDEEEWTYEPLPQYNIYNI